MDELNAWQHTTIVIRRKISRTPIQCSANPIALFFANDTIWRQRSIKERF